jgi:uncharacterized linocin/CFP29 family protein
MNNSNENTWWEHRADPADPVWTEIDSAVLTEVGKVRISQRVFPAVALDENATEVPNEVINFPNLSIAEGKTKPFVEIFQEFALTSTQVKKESDSSKICQILSRMAAKAIALAEDHIIFQGTSGTLPANVVADQRDSAGKGLLGEANPGDAKDTDPNKVSVPIEIPLAVGRPGILYGENTFSAVTEGIANLVRKAQAPNYALFLPTKVFADTFAPPSDQSLVTTADRIKPLVEGGFYGTGTLPEDRGLLVALGGEPTSLYVGREATAEFVRKEGAKYFFRVAERVQFVARDPRAFVLLKFETPDAAAPKVAGAAKK